MSSERTAYTIAAMTVGRRRTQAHTLRGVREAPVVKGVFCVSSVTTVSGGGYPPDCVNEFANDGQTLRDRVQAIPSRCNGHGPTPGVGRLRRLAQITPSRVGSRQGRPIPAFKPPPSGIRTIGFAWSPARGTRSPWRRGNGPSRARATSWRTIAFLRPSGVATYVARRNPVRAPVRW